MIQNACTLCSQCKPCSGISCATPLVQPKCNMPLVYSFCSTGTASASSLITSSSTNRFHTLSFRNV
jgi:hypothetical protein